MEKAIELAEPIYALTESEVFKNRYSLRDQLERAVLSISNNIAEGFERGTTNELLAFLYIARGSAGEVRSMLFVLERLSPFHPLKSELSNLKYLAESCSRQLRAWAESLQHSPIKGQRHLTDQSKAVEKFSREAKAFQKELDALTKKAPGR